MTYKEQNEELLAKLKCGDIVKFKRNDLYFHFAIYIGNGNVIHLTSSSSQFSQLSESSKVSSQYVASSACIPTDIACVREDDFFDVAAYSKAELANWDEKSPYSPEQIVERAKAKLGDSKYSVEKYNCEHFVNEIVYDKAVSKQVNNAILAGTVIGLVVAAIVGEFFFGTRGKRNKDKSSNNSHQEKNMSA